MGIRTLFVMIGTFIVCAALRAGAEVKYGVAEWPVNNRGSHRAVVERDTSNWLKGYFEKKDAVWAHIEWRRRDPNPEAKAIVVYDAETGEQITNVAVVAINQVYGDIIFQPEKETSKYHLYYLPWTLDGGANNAFKPETYTRYLSPADTADEAWLKEIGFTDAESFKPKLATLPRVSLVEIQARTEFDRFDPMEVIATPDEVEALLARHPDRGYLLFPEDRTRSIRMYDAIPHDWVKREYRESFEGEAQPGEIYPFQIGVFAAREDVRNLTLSFSDLVSGEHRIAGEEIHCINIGGNDYLGKPFTNAFHVNQGMVRALWCWVEFPKDVRDVYEGAVEVSAEGLETRTVDIRIRVDGEVLEDGGVHDAWRLSKLKWLDSTLGIDDEVPAPYTPVEFTDTKVGVWNREVILNEQGLPESMRSGGVEVLADPIELVVQAGDRPMTFRAEDSEVLERNPSRMLKEYRLESEDGRLGLTTRWSTEYDGCTDYSFTLSALREDVPLSDVGLGMRVNRDVAKYMIGMRRMGGSIPESWSWKWNLNKLDNYAWVGDANAGFYFKLMHEEHNAPLDSFREYGIPEYWHNDGNGGCTYEMQEDGFAIRAFSGSRVIRPGEPVEFKARFFLTPVKPLDVKKHWDLRQSGRWDPGREGLPAWNIGHMHHATTPNPYINYPFMELDAMKTLMSYFPTLSFNIYYTIRELTNYLPELWALRSLGDEIYASDTIVYTDTVFQTRESAKEPVGHHWLREHLGAGYVTAWTQRFEDHHVDAAIGNRGNSRWNNFYVEGLKFLMEKYGVDGLYIDGVGYDRDTMKRIYKVMQRANPDSGINFHGGNCNHDSVEDGWGHVLPMHIEHLPYFRNCWLGEAFNYDQPPDYWLIEVSGLPFGQTSEMLNNATGGNAYRGMLYGMGGRQLKNINALYAFWDQCRIHDTDMIGYWDKTCPVKTDNKDVLATVYRKAGRSLISLGSWAQSDVDVALTVDWKDLGLDAAKVKLTAPEIDGFQEETVFRATDRIPVEKAKGWLLIAEE